MARRVNTRFVVILSSSLVGAVGIAVGVWGYRYLRNHDPSVAHAAAAAAEQRGDTKSAADNYSREGMLLAQKHRSGADSAYGRAGDLYLKLSRETTSQKDALTYYQYAVKNYQWALTENPRNKAVNEALLEEEYQSALDAPSIDAWRSVAQESGELIENFDAAKPRLYRAQARLFAVRYASQDQVSSPSDAAAKDINDDLDAALKFAPDSGKVVAMRAELKALQITRDARLRGLKPEEANSDRQYLSELADVQQTMLRFLEHRQTRLLAPGWAWFTDVPLVHVNVDVAVALAMLSQDQAILTRDVGRLHAATQLLEAACAEDPASLPAADALGTLYLRMGALDKAEALYKRLVVAIPESSEGYRRLADYYAAVGRDQEAIDAYKQVVLRVGVGGGRDAQRNTLYKLASLQQIAWLSMDLAAPTDTPDDKRKDYLAGAKEATDTLRTMANNVLVQGQVDLLDGRMYAINKDVPQAIAALKLAETNLFGSNMPLFREAYRKTELTLAVINQQMGQLGVALDLVRKAELVYTDPRVQLLEGSLLNRMGRSEDAGLVLDKLLGVVRGPNKSVRFALESTLDPTLAQQATRLWFQTHPEESSAGSAAVVAALGGDNLEAALAEMDQGKYDDALNSIKTVLDQVATNSDADDTRAYQVAIICCTQLKLTPEAKTYAAAALTRFPKSTYFQVVKAQLDQSQGLNTPEAQMAVINAIQDPFDRTQLLADYYHGLANQVLQKAATQQRDINAEELAQCQQDWDSELQTLQERYASIKGNPESRDKMNTLLERMFSLALMASTDSVEPRKGDYLKTATGLVTEIQKLNYDGTDGNIALGRLEIVEDKNVAGLSHLTQAVHQRPEYAVAHMVMAQAYMDLANQDKAKRMDNLNLALDELRQVITLAPNNLLALKFTISILEERGDAASIKEAQGLVASGLAQSPHDAFFLDYSEFLEENVERSVSRRELILAQQPDDRQNRYRLAQLYVLQKNKDMADFVDSRSKSPTDENKQAAARALEGAKSAVQKAIDLVRDDYKKDPKNLTATNYLALLLAQLAPLNASDSNTKSWAEIPEGIQLYRQLTTGTDSELRFNALLAEADYFNQLEIGPNLEGALQANGFMTQPTCRAEAVSLLQDAIKIEPETQDIAERHLADMQFENRNYAEAEKAYLAVIANHKTPAVLDRVNRRVIECELRQGDFKNAGDRLATLLGKQPDDTEALIMRGYSSILQSANQSGDQQKKMLQSAVTDLTRAATLDPRSASALIYRATAEMSLGGGLDSAKKDLIQAKALDKNQVLASSFLAGLYVRTQDYEQAVREYQDTLEAHPTELQVRIDYTNLLLDLSELLATLPPDSSTRFAQTLRQLHPMEKLLQAAEVGSKLYNDPRWVLMYARSLDLQGRKADALRFSKGAYDTLKAEAQEPGGPPMDASVPNAYIGELLSNGKYADALEVSNTVINVPEFPAFVAQYPQCVSFYLKRAAANQMLGHADAVAPDVDQAIAVGVKAGEATGNFAPFIALLDSVKSSEHEGSDAVLSADMVAERLKQNIAANPNGTVAKIGLIQMDLVRNDLAAAQQVVDTLGSPANENLKFLALRESSLVRMQNKQYAAAQKDFQALMQMAPDNVDVLNNYAYLLASWGKPAEAIPVAKQAQALLQTQSNPRLLAAGQAQVADTLGWAYYLNAAAGGSRDDLKSAIDALTDSTQTMPQSAAYLHLAQAEKLSGGSDSMRAALANSEMGAELAATRHEWETLLDLVNLGLPLAQDQKSDADLGRLLPYGIQAAQALKNDQDVQRFTRMQNSLTKNAASRP